MVLTELVERIGPGEAVDDLVAVAARATAVEPARRYPDAGALAAALGSTRTHTRGGTGQAAVRNPYKGLRPFAEVDADDFFGRGELVERLAGHLTWGGRRFLAVVGPSGSGKSSLVRAGLLPALRAGVDGSDAWLIARMTPGSSPLEELRLAVAAVAVGATDEIPTRVRSGAPLGQALGGVLPPGADLLLVVDQLEEAFTLTTAEDERQAFLGALATVNGETGHQVRVVVTLRADFFDRPLRHPALAELVRDGTETVTPLRGSGLERAITGPAANVGVTVQRAVVEAVRDDLGEEPGALPLLQYTLTELFAARSGPTIDLDAYHRTGGVPGALVSRAEAIHGQLDAEGREAARQLFLRLVALGEGTRDLRRRATLDECRSVAPEAMDQVLAAFGDHRLLTFDRDPATRAPTVEVAHEALLVEWGRLRGWVDAARDDLRSHRRLAAAAAEWSTADRDPSYLLRGARLDDTGDWAERSRVALTDVERDYLDAGRSARDAEEAAERERTEREAGLERRSRNRLRALVMVLAVATVVAGALAAFARGQQSAARRAAADAFARELASASVAVRAEDSELGLLLALEAMGATREPLPEALAAVHESLLEHRVVMSVPGDFPAAFSPDGTLLATALGDDPVIRVREVGTAREVAALHGHSAGVVQVEFTPDGTGLVSSSMDGTARRWDVGTETEACRFVGHTDGVFSLSLSADGSRLATRGPDGTVRIWEAATCEPLQVLTQDALGLHFHPDGRRLAVAVAGRGPVVVDTDSGDEVLSYPGDARDVRFSPDGGTLAVATGGSDTLLIDLGTGESRPVPGHEGLTETVDVGPDGTLLATGGQDGHVRVWNVASGELRLELAGTGSNVEHVTFSPDGTLVAGACTSGRVVVWDVTAAGASEVATFPVSHERILESGLSPDGRRVAASAADGRAGIWDVATGELVTPLDLGGRWEYGVWWGPDGERLVTSGPTSSDGRFVLTVWDADGDVVTDVPAGTIPLADLAPDGRRLAAGTDDGRVTIWDLATGEEIAQRDADLGPVGRAAWSPDGSRIAAGTQADALWLWDVAEDATSVLRGHTNVVNTVAWSPDGERVASAGEDGSIRIWVPDTDATERVIEGHAGTVHAIAYSADGTRLVSGSADATVRVWDADTGTGLLTVSAGTPVTSVSISADGRLVSLGGEDGRVRVITLDVDELRGLASDRVTRALTTEECRTHLHTETCPPA